MNIIINTQKLKTALSHVERLVGKNVNLPVLQTIRFTATKQELQLSATNLEMGMIYTVSAKVDKEGDVAIPARVLSNLISNITDEKIHITTKNQTVTIKTDTSTTTILGMPTDEFPIIPKLTDTTEIALPAQTLEQVLPGLVQVTATSETRPELTGVYMQFSKGTISFASTDSFRLIEWVVRQKHDMSQGGYIIPKETATELQRLASSLQGDVSVMVSDTQIGLVTDEIHFVSRLIDGRYPDYKKVIPESFQTRTTVDRQELLRTIQMTSVFSSSIADIQVRAEKDTLYLEAKNSDRGNAQAKIPATIEKGEFTMALNYQYLLDGVRILSTDTVHLEFSGESSPLMLRADELPGFTYVIMPLRA